MIEIRDFYAALVESNDDAIVAKDTEGTVVAWNPAAERLFGYRSREMVGESIRRLLPADRQEEEDRIIERIRRGERVEPFFTRRRRKDGNEIDVLVSVSPVRDGNGTIVGASKIARDAGPMLESQRRLRESEERFRMLAENMNQLAWIAHADGEVFWYNQRWYDFTGTTFDDMQGWGWRKVQHPDHLEQVEQRWRESLAAGEDWEDTFPLRGSEGEYRWFLSRATPIRNETGEIVSWFGTNTDITEQREQQDQIRLLLMEVNHRSKNMLSTVQALARRSIGSNDAGFIARFEQRLRSLAVNQDILVRRAWREVPIHELIGAQLAFLPGKQAAVSLEGPDCALVPRAAEVIGMALHELATNSLKYGALSVEQGHIAITWERSDADDTFTLRWTEHDGPRVVEPEQSGFGTRLIRDLPRHNLAAEVALDFPPEGVCWSLTCSGEVVARVSPAD